MKRLMLPLAALAALLLVAPAAAKEPKEATLCGAEGCATTNDQRTLITMLEQDGPAPPAPKPAPFYRMRVTIDAGPTFTWYYVPSARAILRTGVFGAGMDTWVQLAPQAADLLARTVRGLDPLPVPEPTRVTVGGKTVRDPASYLRLLTQPSVGNGVPSHGDWQAIRFAGASSPWTDGTSTLSFSKRDGLLLRGGEVIKLPPSLVTKIGAGSSLGSPGGGLPWAIAGAAALALALAAAAALLVRRLAGRARPAHTPVQSEG